MPARLVLRTTRPRDRLLAAVARRRRSAGGRGGLDGVLADLDRQAVPARVPGEAVVEGLAWDAQDQADERSWPQGVACLRGGEVLLVAWHRRGRLRLPGGARVSVVDRRDPDRPRYRHVRLAVPRRLGLPLLRPLRVHAGGLAVLGGLLYVADTRAGVRVFRLDDAVADRRGWALPQWRRLRLRGLRCSFLSVGDVDGEPSLVVGEYGRKGSTPRLARWPLDPATGLPPARRCPPHEVHARQPLRMQGVAVHDGTWWLSASSGRGNPGDLHVGRPGAWTRHRGVLPTGPEDLDWDVPGHRLWCASEWPGQRWVFAVAASRWG